MKGFLGSANVDTNSRLCMASSVAGHRRAFGDDMVPGCYDDLDEADLLVLVGSNAAWCHPVLFQRMVRNRRERGARLVVIDPRRTVTGEDADLFSPIAPGTDSALFCGLLVYLADNGALDRATIAAHTTGFAGSAGARPRDRAGRRGHRRRHRPRRRRGGALLRSVPRDAEDGRHLLLARREPVGAGHRQSQRHHQLSSRHRPHRRARHGPVLAHRPAQRHGRTRGRRARQPACRAHGVCARRYRPGAAILERATHGRARRPQSRADVRGDRARRDQGAVGDGDQSGGLAAARRRHARGAEEARAARGLRERAPQRHASRPCPHVLLPAAAWGEKDGTVTNSDRRISRQRAFLPPPGEARPDWWIVSRGRAPAGIWRRRSPIAAPPMCFASTRRFRLSRTTARAISTSAGSPIFPMTTTTRWSRCNGRCATGGATAPRGCSPTAASSRRTARRASSRPSRRRCASRSAPNSRCASTPAALRDQWHSMTRTRQEPKARRAHAGAVPGNPSARRQGAWPCAERIRACPQPRTARAFSRS